MNEAWKQDRDAEDASLQWYEGSGPEEPVTWFQQTIVHGCGLIGFLHCVCNGLPSEEMILPGSELAKFLARAVPLKVDEKAKLLNEAGPLYEASEAVALKGDTKPLSVDEDTGTHFVALVKARDGHLWELEGSRKGPLDRGPLGEVDDALSEQALKVGMRRLVDNPAEELWRFEILLHCSCPKLRMKFLREAAVNADTAFNQVGLKQIKQKQKPLLRSIWSDRALLELHDSK